MATLINKSHFHISKRIVFLCSLVILVLLVAEGAVRFGWLDGLENIYSDLWHILAGFRTEARYVVIVAIDNDTLLEFRDEPLAFWGPRFAQGIKVLRKAGAKIIGLDYLFTTSAESWFKKSEMWDSDRGRTYDIPMRVQLATGKVVLIGWVTSPDQGESQLLLPTEDYLFALPGGTLDVGLANFYSDQDGVIRRFIPSLFENEIKPSLTFPVLLAVKASGLKPSSPSWSMGGREILNTSTPHIIGFVGPPGTVPRVSFLRLLKPMAEEDPEVKRLKDKVIIIASEHVGVQDIHLTPYSRGFWNREGGMMSGAEVHANITETLLSGRFPKPLPDWIRIVSMILIFVTGTLLFFRLHPIQGLGVGLLLSLLCVLVAYLLFSINWIFPIVHLQLGLAISFLGTLGFRLTKEERERKELRQMFGKYVSEELVERLIATGCRPDLGGEAREITVLFSDIRNFTTLSERLSPHQVVEMLNVYLSRACEAIKGHGGTVDKFIGDAIMAVFGSPTPYPDHAYRALSTALDLKEIARNFRSWMHEKFSDISLPEFEIGIGIHTGEAVIGNIGSPTRMEFTAIGDVVNTASRLESLTKEFGWTIVASRSTIQAGGSEILIGEKKKVVVKGREEEMEVFEVIGSRMGKERER